MAQYKSEYSGGSVSGTSCSYARSCNNNGSQGQGTMAPINSSSGKYFMTPNFSSIGYNSLSGGDLNSCSGCKTYFNINDAYGSNGSDCSGYTKRMCNSGCGGGPSGPPGPSGRGGYTGPPGPSGRGYTGPPAMNRRY